MNNTKLIIIGTLLLTNALSVITTLYLMNHRPNIKALDFEIAKMVIKSGSDYCYKIKARNFMARYDMGTAASGCVK